MKQKLLTLVILAVLTLDGWTQPGPYEIREMIAASIENLNVEPINVYRTVNKEVSAGDRSIPVRIYYPSDQESLPVIYHIHGGAWIAGNLETHDNICRRLAAETNSIVVAVDYRRPPEHPFPAALDDSYFVLRWIEKNRGELNGDGRLFLIGDSAGGGLVPAVCIMNLLSDNPVPINGQIIINPAADLREGSDSYTQYGMFIDWFAQNSEKADPLLSPLEFPDFEKLPRSIVVVSENDEIKNDGVRFHNTMLESKNASVFYELKGSGHLGPLWAGNAPAANLVFEFVVAEYRKWLNE